MEITSDRFVLPAEVSRTSATYFFAASSNRLAFCERLQPRVSTERSMSSEKRFVVLSALYVDKSESGEQSIQLTEKEIAQFEFSNASTNL